MSSFQLVYTFNDIVSAIQTIGRGGQLSKSQENALSALNTAAQNFPSLERSCKENERKAVTFVTRRFLETGNFNLSGDHIFTGSMSAISTISLNGYATNDEVNNVSTTVTTLSDRVTSRLKQLYGAAQETVSDNFVTLHVGNITDGSEKGLVEVSNNNSNYILNLSGIISMDYGSFRKITLINKNGTSQSTYAITFIIDGDIAYGNIKMTTIGSNSYGTSNIQEIFITKFEAGVSVYSTVTFGVSA